jgi:UDP-N-acetylmuramate dehydrogenase
MSLINHLPKVEGTYRENVELAPTTWFQVGGKADVLYKPGNTQDLAFFLKNTPKNCPITILGVGSNLIIRDGGIRGVVIKLGRYFNNLSVNNNILTVGASTLDFNVAHFLVEQELTGLEFLVGVPGSIGGAIAMNAGAYGSEIAEHIQSIEGVNINTGEIRQFNKTEMGFIYRGNSLNNQFIFTQATFFLKKDNKENIINRMNEIVESRSTSQPIKEKTGGSTFKNPPGHKAWQLIDEAGCRGIRVGGAQVSEKHCNFLINTGNATASDIENLGEIVRNKVLNKSKINLEWEIKIIGEKLI